MNFVQTDNMKLLLLVKQIVTFNPSTNMHLNPSTNMQIILLVFPSLMDALTSSSECSP